MSRVFIAIESKWPSEIGVSGIRFALWNAGQAAWGALLAITEPVILEAVQVNIVGCFAFSQEVVKGIMKFVSFSSLSSTYLFSILISQFLITTLLIAQQEKQK